MNDDQLDKLFNENFSKIDLPEDDAWDLTSIKLHRKMFYKFSWNRFNVYYLTLILLNSCFTLGMVSNYFLNTKNIDSNNGVAKIDTIYIYKTSENISDTVLVKNTLVEVENKVDLTSNKVETNLALENKAKTNANKQPILKSTDVQHSQLNVVNTTNDITENVKTDTVSLQKVPIILKRKKTIKVNAPRDTIYNIDTIYIKK